MTEEDIQNVLYEFASEKNHRLIVDNCKALNVRGEADLISLTRSNLIHEFEIKRSQSDFQREFQTKKKKHRLLEGNGRYTYSANYFWFVCESGVLNEEEVPDYAGLIEVGENGFEIIRKASRLHTEKATDRIIRYLERGVTIRYWKLRKKD